MNSPAVPRRDVSVRRDVLARVPPPPVRRMAGSEHEFDAGRTGRRSQGVEEDAVFHEEGEKRPPPSAQTVAGSRPFFGALLRRTRRPRTDQTTATKSDTTAWQCRGLVLAEESVDVEGVGGLTDLLIANSREKYSGEACGANTPTNPASSEIDLSCRFVRSRLPKDCCTRPPFWPPDGCVTHRDTVELNLCKKVFLSRPGSWSPAD